jgi:hypothetical protein
MVDIVKIEESCLRKIEIIMNNEKDPILRSQIEEAGRAICKCMSEQSINEKIIHRTMVAATRALPMFTVARPEKISLR